MTNWPARFNAIRITSLAWPRCRLPIRNGGGVKLAIDKLGADRILFGTDYGVGGGDRGGSSTGLATQDQVLTPAQRQQIYSDNSRQLLARKGITV